MSFEKYGWMGTSHRSVVRPKSKPDALLNRKFYRATDKRSGNGVICCEAPGGFLFIYGEKIKAARRGSFNLGGAVSLAAASEELGLVMPRHDFGKCFELSARLIVSDRIFADGLLTLATASALAVPAKLLIELAKISSGAAGKELDTESPLFCQAIAAGELVGEEMADLKMRWSAWFKGQQTSGIEQRQAEWRRVGWETVSSSSAGYALVRNDSSGTFLMTSANNSGRLPGLYDPLLIKGCSKSGDVFPGERRAEDVNQATLVIRHWVNEVKDVERKKRYNDFMSAQRSAPIKGPRLG